jgi:hypothetical protein
MMQMLQYGELPFQLRMMIMLLALVAVSEFMRLFSVAILASLGVYLDPVSVALPIVIFYATLRSLKKRGNAAPLGAVIAMSMGVLDDGYAIYSMHGVAASYPVVALWWPVTHLACYLAFIAIVISPGTRSFYHNAGQD